MNRIQKIMYRLIGGFFILIGLIPRKAAQRIGQAIGSLWFRLDRRHRRIALENWDIAFWVHRRRKNKSYRLWPENSATVIC